jgi:hypothetical protein
MAVRRIGANATDVIASMEAKDPREWLRVDVIDML